MEQISSYMDTARNHTSPFRFPACKKSFSLCMSPFLTCRMGKMTVPFFKRVEKYAILWSWGFIKLIKVIWNALKICINIFLHYLSNNLCVKKSTVVFNSKGRPRILLAWETMDRMNFFIRTICLCSVLFFSNVLVL